MTLRSAIISQGKTGIHTQVRHLFDTLGVQDDATIWVSPQGDDTYGQGTANAPFLTLTKAFTLWNAARPVIMAMPGEYAEAAMLTWPGVNGLLLNTLGPVSISNTNAAAQVLLIQPGAAATTSFTATMRGPVNLAADTQIGLKIANTSMTKKLIVDLDGLMAEMNTSGDSIQVVGTVSGQAIRLYAKNLDLEGLLHFTVNDAGSRLRVAESSCMGGITTAGAVASEVALRNTQVLTGGLTVAAEQKLTNVGCVYATNAEPTVYTNLANVFAPY